MVSFFDALPDELLMEVIICLDKKGTAPPLRNGNEPSVEAYHAPQQDQVLGSQCFKSRLGILQPLKALSMTSHRWRRLTRSVIFSTIKVPLERLFESKQSETETVSAFITRAFSTLTYRFPVLSRLMVQSLTLHVRTSSMIYSNVVQQEINHFWKELFGFFDPIHVSITAPPKTLSDLLSCPVNMSDAWAFNILYQRIDLYKTEHRHYSTSRGATIANSIRSIAPYLKPQETARDATKPLSKLAIQGQQAHCPLVIKEWDILLFNAGSSFPNYGTYHYYDRCPPCLIQINASPLMTTFDCLRYFEYTAVFPHVTQFRKTVIAISSMNNLHVLALQLVPDFESPLFHDLDRIALGNTNLRDCWAEARKCYTLVIQTMIDRTRLKILDKLNVFTSYDCDMTFMQDELLEIFSKCGPSEWSRHSPITWTTNIAM